MDGTDVAGEIEVEVKVPADLDQIRDRLAEESADPVDVVDQIDTYYDAPHRSFPHTDEALRLRRESLAGEKTNRARITYKGPLLEGESTAVSTAERDRSAQRSVTEESIEGADSGDRSVPSVDDSSSSETARIDTPDRERHHSKARAEVESHVDDANEVDTILTRLGFEPAATVKKHRERYAFDDVIVTLDDVDGLGTFVEVEVSVPNDDDLDSARERAFEVVEQLGLNPGDGTSRSYLELLLDDAE